MNSGSLKLREFDPERRFIAKLDQQSVGIIHAHADRLRKQKKDFIMSFGIIREFRDAGFVDPDGNKFVIESFKCKVRGKTCKSYRELLEEHLRKHK